MHTVVAQMDQATFPFICSRGLTGAEKLPVRGWAIHTSRFISMPETKSILSAISDEDVKGQVFEVLGRIETYSLIWVDNIGDLLIHILDKEIDLAIIDDNLDGMAISKLIEIIKKSRPKIPLIVITSGKSRDEFARVLEHGIFYFIIKPVNGEELKEAVESVIKTKPVTRARAVTAPYKTRSSSYTKRL